MAVRIIDVAREAGVSTATVSRVLNNDPRITPKTRNRVLTAIKSTGYRPNAIARSLKTNKTRTVGFLAPEIANDFYMNVAQGVEDRLKEDGYSLIVCNSNENITEEKRRIELLAQNLVDGIIIIPSTGDGAHFNILNDLGIPAVLADRSVNGFSCDKVLAANREGSREAISALIKQGCRRIGFLGGNLSLDNFRERYEGYLQALEENNITPEKEIIRFGDSHISSGFKLMSDLMESPNPPDEIFIANYYLHVGAAKYLVNKSREKNIRVNLSSFDDMELSAILGFSRLTVAQPMTEMGRAAAELLLERIRGTETGPPKTVRLGTKLNIIK